MPRCLALVMALVVALEVAPIDGATYAPNQFLGKCLDEKWVKDVEAKYKISSTARDAQLRLEHPHLHAALPTRRFAINDPRINGKTPGTQLYSASCTNTPFSFWGVGAQVDPTTGAVTNLGSVNGSLVVEYKNWVSSQLGTLVFSILTQEVLGYNVSFYGSANSQEMGARMSSVSEGKCTPVHVNVEEWGRDFTEFMNELYKTGTHSYVGRSGLYTTAKFVDTGLAATPVYNGDFYRDYATSTALATALDAELIFQNKDYYPINPLVCADGLLGCKDGCSRTDTCTKTLAKNGKCIGFALMYPTYDDGKTEAILANNKIPSYHCFLGFSGVEKYAVEMESKGVPAAFYHFEPDPFHYIHEGKFQRIFLPRTLPELAAMNTAIFGENGYGEPTSNPVSVDYPLSTLNIYAAMLIQDHAAVAGLLSRMTLSELDMSTLMKAYVAIQYKGATPLQRDDPIFSASCAWVRDNYQIWRRWLNRLPLCKVVDHMQYSFRHCDDGQPREVRWQWKEPHPLDATKPYVCDGGETELPRTITTSKSCAWLKANVFEWFLWTYVPPTCNYEFYSFRVSKCDARSKRTAEYYWLLPDPADPSKSLECRDEHGDALPASVEFPCGFEPFQSPLAKVVMVIAAVLAAGLAGMIAFVIKFRREPIIKRSQYEFLTTMIVGGILMCGSAVLYAGEPSMFLCGARPFVTSLGFTLIFGALVVKSLRVYRVFMSGAMKRVVLSSSMMFKILGIFVSVDLLILVVWFIVDFPKPVIKPTTVVELGGETVNLHFCTSSSFIFTALLIFWKAIVLFMGLYLSFLIRNVSSDFQESIWIFASSLVVLFGSIIILPMAYLVELPASVFYAFLAFMLLSCTALVMAMMLVPKVRRLHEKSNDTTTSGTHGEHTSHHTSEDTKHSPPKANHVRLGMKAQVSVTPVEEFRPKSTRDSSKKIKRQGPGAPDSSDSD